jgi:anti-anti-sigma regulatory factor
MVDYEVGEKEGPLVVLRLRGELVGDLPTRRIKEDLERHYVDDGVREIRVDLAELDHITLEGIAVLLELRAESGARGKRFLVQNPQGQVLERLSTTGVLGFLREG